MSQIIVIIQNIKCHINVEETFACKKREMQIRVATRRFRHRNGILYESRTCISRCNMAYWYEDEKTQRGALTIIKSEWIIPRKKIIFEWWFHKICWCFTKFNFYQGKNFEFYPKHSTKSLFIIFVNFFYLKFDKYIWVSE